MARLVTKFKYLNQSGKRKLGGYAKYIATREGVEKIDDTHKLAPTTSAQKRLIEKIVGDFPDTQEMIEYHDYLKSNSFGSASDFISRAAEENAHEMMNVKTYADYIATRPRVERFGKHGLFTDDGVQVRLSKVSEELNLHSGNVWTVIISLRREDAERLGFDNGLRWRDMLRTQTQALSENFKIPMEHLKWFAAFHNESNHPHVHMIVYSSVQNEGYLSERGIENLRASFANDIFHQDLLCIYQKQNEHRDALRMRCSDIISEISGQILSGSYSNPRLENLLLKLAEELSHTSGKLVYGYLNLDLKKLVDKIVDELEGDERISVLYDLWYEQREKILSIYTDDLPERVPLSQNEEFRSIKNAVIRETVDLCRQIKSELDKGKRNVFAAEISLRLLGDISKILEDKIYAEQSVGECHTDRKLKSVINEKKRALGLKQ